jgi:peptidoglycan/LPS O-acetylase OafA/YrhL
VKSGVGQIPSLDGIRAASVMVVFLAHAGLNEWIPGNFGVTVFFFLSGFLITSLLRVEFDRSSAIDLRAFYARRALRIFPPMYLVLFAASALTIAGLLEGSVWPQALLAQALHLTNYYVIANGWWDGRAPGTWIYWSLAVEEHFYLLFPLGYLLMRRHVRSASRQALIIAGVCALALAWRVVLVFVLGAIKERTYIATDTRIDSILFGCLLAIAANPVLDKPRIPDRWWIALFPAGLALIIVSFVVRVPEFQETVRYTLQGIGLVPLFVVAIRWHDRSVFRVLSWRPVAFLGVISYSLYLVHPTVIFGVHEWTSWPAPAQGAAALALTLAISVAIYLLVERPCAALRKRLSRVAPLEPRPQGATAGAAGAPSEAVAGT